MKIIIRKPMYYILVIIFILLSPTSIISANEASATPSGIPLSELESQVDAFAEEQVGKTTPGMAVVVVKDGKIILLKGYGYQDIANRTPVDPQNTVFEFGSITKLLVWTSAMQLVEEEKLDLNEDIKKYLPKDFTDQLAYEYPVTMLDLMHHTAGFEQHPFDWNPISPESVIAPLNITLLEHQPKQIYKPKEIIAYSNYGTSLAGFVIEQITGEKFYDYASENILRPAGMGNTTVNPLFEDNPQLINQKAQGYMTVGIGTGDGNFRKGIWSFLWQYPAGAANGTVEDLGKYLIALMPNASQSESLFKDKETISKLLKQSYSPNHSMSSNAHGFWEHYNNGISYWHPGNTAAFSSFFALNPKEQFGVAILTNASYAIEPTYGLGDLLLTRKNEPENIISETVLPSAYELSGRYMYSMYSDEGYFKSASYLANLVKIDAIDENTIKVSSLGKNSTYRQTSPYLYQLQEANSIDLFYTQPQLYVEIENETVKRISSGHMMDIIPIPSTQAMWYFWVSVVLFAISSLFFTILLFVMLTILLKNRSKRPDRNIVVQNYFLTAYALLGAGLVINSTFMLFQMVIQMPIQSIAIVPMLYPSTILNGVISVLFIIIFLYKFIALKGLDSTSTHRTVNRVIVCFFILFTFLLYNWNLLRLF